MFSLFSLILKLSHSNRQHFMYLLLKVINHPASEIGDFLLSRC